MTDEPTDTLSIDLLLGVILKFPSTNDAPPYPTKSENLKYCFPCLVKGSTSETDAWVSGSFNFSIFLIVWPTNPIGLPDKTSTITVSLLKYSAADGLNSKSSKFNIFGSTPYNTRNNIFIASFVPLVS